MEFYDTLILKRVGKTLGKHVKVDACTSATLRERYVRIYMQKLLRVLVKSIVAIRGHKQKLFYEGEGALCKISSHLGHIMSSYPTHIGKFSFDIDYPKEAP